MSRTRTRSYRIGTLLAAASLLTTMVVDVGGVAAAAPVPATGPSATAPSATGDGAAPATAVPTPPPGSLAGSLDLADGYDASPAAQKKRAASTPQTVFVELSAEPATAVSARVLKTAKGSPAAKKKAAKAAVGDARALIEQRAKTLAAQVEGRGAEPLFTVSNAVPGFAVRVTAKQRAQLAAQRDVVKISPIVPKHPLNAHTAQLTRVLNAWQDTPATGEGVSVAIIDTGIDYTHADFGGPGTTTAYEEALKTSDSITSDWRSGLTELAAVKIGGGFDFVGNDYDASPLTATGELNPNYQPVPHPDPNPLDCQSHGTHVAGTVAGYGENADGTTFTGNDATLTGDDLDGMKIGPGMAPGATLYSFKVFGCDGSTDAVIPALDAALDPNGDGDFSDHMDVVNLSLGADYATPDDPENDVVNKLADNGVLPVIAMGNGGDLTDIGGSPGNAVGALAVASSVDSYQLLSGIELNAPAAVEGTAVGQVSVNYEWSEMSDITADVVPVSEAGNSDGCEPFSAADAAAVAGKIAWLTWDSNDASRRCGSGGRTDNAANAGAVGVILTGDVPVFTAGIAGNDTIPAFQLTLGETTRLADTAAAGTLNVTFSSDLLNNQPSNDASINDLVSSFSSRGTHGSIGVVKPDITGPGDTITSAGMGTGDGAAVMSGTSMATPHVAGIAALVTQQHPDWSVERLKAALMNSASHDLYTGANQTGHIYGPNRVGAGRVDALDAVTTDVIAYNADVRNGISASFGVVEVPAGTTVTQTRTITVENTGGSAANLTLSYQPAVEQPGVSYSVSPAAITLDAGDSQDVTVTLTATSSALRHTIDPTMEVAQGGNARQYVSDASGWLQIEQSAKNDLRVPVYGAVKPVSTTKTAASTVHGAPELSFSGKGFDQGDPGDPTSWTSMASVMELGATSAKLPPCADADGTDCVLNETARGGDIHYVGAGSTPHAGSYADGWLYFGVAAYGNAATIGNTTVPYVDFDVDGDDVPDYEVYAQNFAGTDVLVAWLIDLNAGAAIDVQPVNFWLGDVDTNVFDSNLVILPVWPEAIGVTDSTTSFPISYTVGTNSVYTNNANGDIDEVGPVHYDVVKPRIAASDEGSLWIDQDGTAIRLNPVDKAAKALVFHLHNASGTRAQVLDVAPPPPPAKKPQTITFTTKAPSKPVVGDHYTPKATASSGLPVTFSVQANPAGACTISKGTVSFAKAGACAISANQAGNEKYLPAPQVQQLVSTGMRSQTVAFSSTRPSPALVRDHYRPRATASSGLPVSFSVTANPAGTCTISKNTVSFDRPGTCVIHADQGGNATYQPARTAKQSVAVARCHPFPDVLPTNQHCANISWLKGQNITKPADGLYHPLNGVNRGAMAAFLFRLTHPGTAQPACTSKPFSDVPVDSLFCGYIQWAKDNHIAYGYGDGSYGPDRDVTRGAMAAYLQRIASPGKAAPACTTKPFDDVAVTDTFCGVITWIADHGITYGVGNGQNYGTTLPVTRQAMASFMHRVAGLI